VREADPADAPAASPPPERPAGADPSSDAAVRAAIATRSPDDQVLVTPDA
jgi:hypothetical protein